MSKKDKKIKLGEESDVVASPSVEVTPEGVITVKKETLVAEEVVAPVVVEGLDAETETELSRREALATKIEEQKKVARNEVRGDLMPEDTQEGIMKRENAIRSANREETRREILARNADRKVIE